MSNKEKAEKARVQILRDAFEGMKGRQPRSDKELDEWLATDEGKQATIFSPRPFRGLAKPGMLKRSLCAALAVCMGDGPGAV